MFGFGKVPCVVCDRQVSQKDALRLRDRKDTIVCRNCFAQWDRDGRKCGRCESPVRGAQGIGLFSDRYRLGHEDCGAERLAISF